MPNWLQDSKGGSNLKNKPRQVRAFMIGLNAKTNAILVNPPIWYQFQYNPNLKTDKKTVNWVITSVVGDHNPLIHYGSGGSREIHFQIMLNAYEYGAEMATSLLNVPGFSGIRSEIAKLQLFMYPPTQTLQESIKKSYEAVKGMKTWFGATGNPAARSLSVPRYESPPAVLFGWGLQNLLTCIVKDISIRETFWNSWLDPLRAEADVTLIVDERNITNQLDHSMRIFLSAIGSVTNMNPLDSLPGAKGGKVIPI